MAKDVLGELETLVLLAALRLGNHAYGLSIADEICETARRETSRASVYVTLRRLERKDLIATRHEDRGGRQGKPRRLVQVTPRGVTLLRLSMEGLQRMSRGLEGVLDRP